MELIGRQELLSRRRRQQPDCGAEPAGDQEQSGTREVAVEDLTPAGQHAAGGASQERMDLPLGLSTINVRLKLNYDATKALAEISSIV